MSHAGGRARLVWESEGQRHETPFDRFLPVGVNRGAAARTLDIVWRDFADLALTDPFFGETATKASKLATAAHLFTTTDRSLALVATEPTLPFGGMVFHMARTGSTLIHRLLSCTGKVSSASEIAATDRVVELTRRWPLAEQNAALRDFMAVLRRSRRTGEMRFVVKMTDTMASLSLPRYRAAFPGVPWIFLYRDPVEVMASIIAKPTGMTGQWFRNRTVASRKLGMPALNDPGMWFDEFVARTLGRSCMEAARVAQDTPGGLFLAVDYARLPDAIWETIAPHFGIELDERDRELMRAEAKFSAKTSEQVEFAADSASKQEKATPRQRQLVERFVAPAFAKLKELPQG